MQRAVFLFALFFTVFYLFPRETDEIGGDVLKRNVLLAYKDTLRKQRNELARSQYYLGYGNLTGFKLSYQDNLENRNILLWPFREYSREHPWTENQDHSILPNEVSDKVKLFYCLDPVVSSGKAYHLNISGHVYGEFLVSETAQSLKPFSFRLPQYLWEYYRYFQQEQYEDEKQRYEQDPENNSLPQEIVDTDEKIGNITTYKDGLIDLRIDSLASSYPDLDISKNGLAVYDDAVLVVLSLTLKNRTEADSNSFDMFGVYFQNTGELVALTRSAKFRGNHALPHFTMDEANFNKSKTLMARLVNATNIEEDVSLEDINRSLLLSQLLCELVSYFQFEKTAFTQQELRFIDDELQDPKGVPLPKRLPELEISRSVIYSPDCALLVETTPEKPLVGNKLEVTMNQIYRFFVLLVVLQFLNLNLFRRQTNANQTPSRLSNVSKFSIFLLSLYDSIVCLMSVLYLWNTQVSLVCTCLGSLSGILFIGLEVRYMTSISYTQANERGTTLWEILRGSRQNAVAENTNETGGTPETGETNVVNGTANENGPANANPNVNANNWLYFDESSVLVRYIVTGFMISLIFLNMMLSASLWRVSVRHVIEYIGCLLINSYWVPQFFRNTLKNRRKTFLWEFVFGSSMVRLVPIVYLCLNRSNPFRHGYNPTLVITVSGWLLFQIFMLYLQSSLGPRFWVSERWLPEQYHYHPVMSVADLENGFASDILASMKPHLGESGVSFCDLDCPICMSTVTVPVLSNDTAKNKKTYETMMKNVMVTPCHHIFHTSCLEGWMVHKLQCPVCRCPLPPV